MKSIHVLPYSIAIFLCIVLQIFQSCGKSSSMVPIADVLPNDNYALPEISVQANIRSELIYQTIEITQPQSYETPFEGNFSQTFFYNTFGISDAHILVHIDGISYEFIESQFHPHISKYHIAKGRYFSKEKFQGIPGKAHTLTITYNNKTYTATDSMIPVLPVTHITELFSSHIPEYGITFDASVFGVQYPYIAEFQYDYIAYDVDSNYTIDSSTIRTEKNSHYNYFFNKYISPAFLHDIQMNQNTVSYGFSPEQMFIIKKRSISDAYQNYLFAVFRESKWAFSKFRSTPANVPTNMSNGGVGFFSTSDIYIDSILYKTLLEKLHQKK